MHVAFYQQRPPTFLVEVMCTANNLILNGDHRIFNCIS
jgi:hypothetical protein